MWNSKVANTAAALAHALVEQCERYLISAKGPLTLGYSGGLDSTVLLHALLKAGGQQRLTAVHVHHGLQPLADTWLAYCEQECARLAVNFAAVILQLTGAQNVEGRARRERRSALLRHTSAHGCLVLAQHQNDQAETVLLQLLRGAGPQGLSAMQPLSEYQGYTIWRPMLGFLREELVHIAKHWQLHWVEDPTNQELVPDRNYLRQHIIPELAQRWPQLVPTLARNAELQQDAVLLQRQIAAEDWQQLANAQGGIAIAGFVQLSPERQRNLLYRWLLARGMQPPNQKVFARVWQELLPARADANPQVAWSAGVFCRYAEGLFLLTPQEMAATQHTEVVQLQPQTQFEWGQGVLTVDKAANLGAERVLRLPLAYQHITLAPVPKGAKLQVNGHHRQVRECWRAQGLAPWRRQQTPGIFYQGQLVAVVGVGVSDALSEQVGAHSWGLRWDWQELKSQW